MKRGILVLIAVLAFVFGQSYTPNCESTDVYFLYDNFDGSNTYAQDISYSAFGGPNVRMGVAFPTLNDLTADENEFQNQISIAGGIPLTVAGLEAAVEKLVEQSPAENRRILFVVEYHNSFNPQSNILSVANRIKQNTTYPIEIAVISAYGASNKNFYDFDLASGPSHVVDDTTSSSDEVTLKALRILSGINSTYCSAIGSRVSTFDGSSFSFNGLGDFWLYRANFLQVQARLAPCNDDEPTRTTCIRSVAINYDGDRFEFSIDPISNQPIYISGGSVEPLTSNNVEYDSGAVYTLNLPGFDTPFTTIEVQYGDYYLTLVYGNGLGFTVTLRTSIYDLGRSRGLCGTFDGCRDNDFYSVNQVYINPASSAADIYNGFADTWRVDSNDALFEYGINQQYYYPNYPEYTKEWNPIMGLSGVSETAATNCGFFSDKSKYFYDVCTEAYSRTMEHGAAVRGVALFQLAQTCADFCASGRLDNPIVDFTYCKNTCPVGNELDLHKVDYDATNIPHLLQTSQWGSKFQTALGGTYTLELQSSFCYQPQINVTINVVCESSPSVNAGSDRTIRRINQNVNPSVVLQATATDVNTQHLQYSWKLIEYPAFDNDTWEKLGLQFNTAPVLDQNTHQIVYDFLFLNEASITYNSPILYLEHNIFVAGQWVWEVAVFDGCSIVRDNVTLNYVCETCDAIATYPITDINYKNNDYTNTASHQFDHYNDGGHAVNGGVSFTTIVDNSNNFEMEYLSGTNILFYTYHNNFINTTTEVVNGNTTGTPVPTSHPILSNFRFTRTEGSDFILTTTDTFTTTTIITEYYDALSNMTEKCQIRITNSDNDSGSIQVTNEWEWDQADMFDGAVHNCLGDYNIRTSYHDVNCGGTIDSYQNLRVNCSTSPIAHLITCQNTINYDYNTNSWPTVELDGSDSKDFDVTETLFYRYEITSQPALGSNDQYITCNAPGNTIVAGSNRIYANCPQTTTFVPSWPGDYTVKLTVGDGCTYSSETTTIRAVCENITPTLALTYIPDSRNTTNPTFYTLVANTTVATENPVIYSYRFVSIPTGAPEPNPMQTTYSPVSEFSADLYLGGSYTVEVMVSDGCWTQGVNRTFIYTCATAPALSGVTATASNWEDLGFGAFGYSTSTISATIAYSPAGRTGLVTIDLVSQPADSTQSFSQQSFSNTPTWNFAPTRPGSYIFQITANDGCSLVTRNVTLTTTCPALSAAFSIDQATYVWNGTDAVTVVLTATDGSTQPGIIYSYSIQSPEPETAPIVINTQVVNFNLVDYIGVWTVTLTVFDGCSTRNVTRTFTVNCQWTLSVNTIAAQTKVYGNNRFDRVTFVPTFTTNYPDEWNYAYVWDVRSAPVDSLFAPYNTTVNEYVGTTTNTVGPVQVSSDPDIWTITTTEVIETRRVNTVRYVTLANGIAAENYAVCFSPDLSGTYTARIQVQGYCAGQFATQTATLTANCNDAPVANAGEDRTVTFQGVNTGSTYVSFNGTATDANNDKLSHSWSIVSVPADSMIIVNDSASRIRNQDSLLSGFLPDVAGAYTLQLTVTDGCSTSTDTVTITVACNNNFTIPQSMVRQTQNFDGYTPVAFREFNIVATPQCDRDFQWTLTHFVPTPIVPPPTPEPQPQPTAGASQVAASLLAILALIALLL